MPRPPPPFLQQLRANYPGPLVVIWDNGPAHRGAAIRSYLTTPDLHLRLVALPAYSPDFNADEAVWDWAREEVTANECLGTKAKVQEKMNQFFGGLAHRKEEVKRLCRTRLQARADALIFTPAVPLPITAQCSSHLGFGLGPGAAPACRSGSGLRRRRTQNRHPLRWEQPRPAGPTPGTCGAGWRFGRFPTRGSKGLTGSCSKVTTTPSSPSRVRMRSSLLPKATSWRYSTPMKLCSFGLNCHRRESNRVGLRTQF